MKTARNIMYSISILLLVLFLVLVRIFDDLHFYYHGIRYTEFNIIFGAIIMVFLLIGIVLHYAVLAKEKHKFKSAVIVSIVICIFAVMYFGGCIFIHDLEADTKYFEFSSPNDANNTIIITERRGFLGNGDIDIFQRTNRFFIQKRGFIQTLSEWPQPFSDNQYSIEWDADQVTIRYIDGSWQEKVIYLK